MQYVEIRIEAGAGLTEALEGWLCDEGLSYQLADETTLCPPPPGRVRVHLYVEPEERRRVLSAFTAAFAAEARDLDIQTAERDEDEWRDQWKRYFTTRRIGRLALVPSWEAGGHAPLPGEITLQLDPGRAFGTGGHASTRLCLQLIDAHLPADTEAVLDVGCGCGVLAIAALRCAPGARALALDIDPEAVEVTEENAGINGVSGRLVAATTDVAALPAEERFDWVLANLSGPTLLTLAPALRARLRPDPGRLVVSGILTEEAPRIAARFRDLGLATLGHVQEEEWSALLLGPGPDPAGGPAA
jgi:ribosomal protein L11 methyltransferase